MTLTQKLRTNRDALVNARKNHTTARETVAALIDAIGYENAAEIIAAMVNAKGEWDGRISRTNRAWAAEQNAPDRATLDDMCVWYCDEIHPAHMDEIANAMRTAERPAEKEEEPETTTANETIFPNLTKAVNEHFNNAENKFIDELDELTCKEALNYWYWRERMTAAAKKMIEESDPDAKIPLEAQRKMFRRFTRENEKDRARYLKKLEKAAAAADPEYIVINMEWKRNATWGMNPTAEIIGERTRTAGTASGCGYDKASAATASAANAHPEILRILYTHAENGGNFPYSVYTFAGLPYFDGGCGMSCFYNVFEACGYRFKQTANGKRFDAYAITKGGVNA